MKTLGHDEDFSPRPASEATHHRPGSLGKIEVMRLRVERGESLWHPQDNDLPPEPKLTRVDQVAGIRVWVMVEGRWEA